MKFFYALASALIIGGPAHAWSNQLQYRSTTCQVEKNGEVISRGRCNAGFAYDTAVRVIKYWWPGGEPELSVVGQQGTQFGSNGDCLVNHYDNGDTLAICTEKSSYELGIMGD